MKSFFISTTSRRDLNGGCGCANQCKLELQISDDYPALDFLGEMGFASHDTIQGYCGACGKPLRFRRLTISSVENLRSGSV